MGPASLLGHQAGRCLEAQAALRLTGLPGIGDVLGQLLGVPEITEGESLKPWLEHVGVKPEHLSQVPS